MPCISSRNHPRGFTLRELMVVTACIGVLLALLVPAINAYREAERRNRCINNVRQLGMGVLNYESANGRFPTATDAAGPLHKIAPGTLHGEESSGYSWIVKVLSSMDTGVDEIRRVSKKYTAKPFDPSVTSFTGDHFSTLDASFLHCPAYVGDRRAASDIPSEYDKLNLAGGRPVIVNYAVFVGTHVDAHGVVEENGVIISQYVAEQLGAAKGIGRDHITDGIAQTLLVCETREPLYSAWFDGQTAWVVGIDPVGATNTDARGNLLPANHLMGVGSTGRKRQPYSDVRLRGSLGWPGMSPRRWGPSSMHTGGVVVHGFLDNHVQLVSPDADPAVYYKLITRSGGETVNSVDDL